MADNTGIEWTDATWNPITGCSIVSEGCRNCYAMRLAAGRLKNHPSRRGLTNDRGKWTGEVRFNESWLDQPLRWTRPRRVFVVAHGDLFHENVLESWLDQVFAVMALADRHVFQVLTKRPRRAREYLEDPRRHDRVQNVIERAAVEKAPPFKLNGRQRAHFRSRVDAWAPLCDWPLRNVWLGTSAEDQATAHERIPELLSTPAAVRWLSAEPLLAPMDLSRWLFRRSQMIRDMQLGPAALSWDQADAVVAYPLDWVVTGGESGPGARPMDESWVRRIRDDCASARIPFFLKQMARREPIPPDLMHRQYPKEPMPF